MRAGVLSLAFDVLGATAAWSDASVDNVASNRVSEKLGYEQVGYQTRQTGEGTASFTRLRLNSGHWKPAPDVRVEGAEAVRDLLLG